MKHGLSMLLLGFLINSANASTLGDAILKGLSSGHGASSTQQNAPQTGEGYYGGKDLSHMVLA